MNIAIVSPYGMSTVIFTKTLSKLLDENGHKVFTVSPYNGYQKEIDQIKSNHFYTDFYLGFSPIRDLIHILKIRNFITKNKINLLITFTTKPNIFVPAYLFAKKNIFSLMAVRGLGRIYSPKKNSLLSILKIIFLNQLYKLSLLKTNCLWCTNNADKEYLKNLIKIKKLKTIITRNSIDLNFYKTSKGIKIASRKMRKKLGLSKNSFLVLLVGRLIPQKGIYEFMKLSEIFEKEYKFNIHFLLIAPEEKKSNISIPISKINDHQNNFSNFTWIPFAKDIRPFYESCSISILPSFYKEGGHPRAILEAMAFGKPVISSNTPEARGPIKNNYNGYLVRPKDIKDLKNKIFRLLNDESLCKEMGKNSLKKVVNEYSDIDQLQKILSYINSLRII